MRPPVTHWAYDNVFVRMAVVAVAWLTGVAVLSGVLSTPAVQAQVPEPTITVSTSHGSIWATDFEPDALLMITIESEVAGSWMTDESGNFDGNNYGLTFDVSPGDTVYVDDGTNSADLYLEDLSATFDTFDETTLTVTGTTGTLDTPAGPMVMVRFGPAWRSVEVTGGEWAANFGNLPADPAYGEGILPSFGAAMGGSASVADPDGDMTQWDWSSASIHASPADDYLWGNAFRPGGVALTVAGVPITPAPTADENGYFEIYVADLGIDISPGQEIVASQAPWTAEVILADLEIIDVDTDTGVVSGNAPSGRSVDVHAWTSDGGYASRVTTALANNTFSVDFSAGPDIITLGLGTSLRAHIYDDRDLPEHDATISDWLIPDPRFSVETPDQIWSTGVGWTPETTVTLTIDDPTNGPGVDHTATTTMDTWGPEPHATGFYFGIYPYVIEPGFLVTVTDGVHTNDLTIVDITVDTIDEVDSTLSGTAPANAFIEVNAGNDSMNAHRSVQANGSGEWFADFGNPGPQGHEHQTVAFLPGVGGAAETYDAEGDGNHRGWHVPDPRFKARVDDNGFSGWDWTPSSTVTVTVDGAHTFEFDTDEWGNFDGEVDIDLVPGQYVEADDVTRYKDFTIRNLVVTDVDVDNDIVYGTSTIGDEIYVGIHSEDGNYRNVVADGSGNWTADFGTTWQDQGTYDIVLGTGGNAHYWEPDGDETQRTFRVSDPYITASVIHEEVWASDFPDEPDGQTLYYRLDDPATAEIEYEGDMPLLVQDGWTEAGDRSFGRYDVQAGHVYTVRNRPFGVAIGDGIERVLDISHVVVTGIDDVVDVITGTANFAEGPRLCVWSNDAELCSENPAFSWDTAGDGSWVANFGAVGSDVAPGHWNSVSQFEDDGDETHFWWNLPPWIVVELAEEDEAEIPLWPDVVRAEQWTGNTVTLEVNGAVVAEWINDGSWHHRFELPSIDLDPWDVVRIYDGDDDKTVAVEPLYIDNVNYYGDIPPNIVEGTADDYRNLRVQVNASVGGWWAERWVNADDTGYFLADFGQPGNGWREQWTAELGGAEGLGRVLFLETYDSDNDRVEARQCEGVPRVAVARSDGRVDAFDFPVGADVTIEITGTGGTFTDTQVAERNPDNPCETIATFDVGDFVIEDGATVVVSAPDGEGGTTTVTHSVIAFSIEGADPDADTVFGFAPAGADVWVQADGDNWRYVVADDDGVWTADFATSGSQPGEEQVVDLGPGSSGSATMLDPEGNTTELSWRISNASFVVDPSSESLWANDFAPNSPVTVNVDGVEAPGSPFGTDDWGNFGTSWDPGELDLQALQLVELSDGETVKDHTITSLTVVSVDVETNVVSGTAEAGSSVWVNIHNDPGNTGRTVIVDEFGVWSADFDDPGDQGGTWDLQVGENGQAQQCDAENDCTNIDWRIPNAQFQVSPSDENIWGNEWEPNTELTITVDGLPLPGGPYYTDGWGNFGFGWDQNDLDLLAGDLVVVSDGTTTKDHTVTDLEITGVDPDTNVVSGVAAPGTTVDVWEHQEGNNITVVACDDGVEYPCNGEDPGTWHADFTGIFDIEPGVDGNSGQCDLNNDCTNAFWHVSEPPRIVVTWGGTLPGMTEVDIVEGHNWPEGEVVTITVDDGGVLNSWTITVGERAHADPPWWFDTQGGLGDRFELHLDGVFDLAPGQVVTATSPSWEKSVEIVLVTIDTVDLDGEIVSGSAPGGQDVQVTINQPWQHEGPVAGRSTEGVSPWFVDFSFEPPNGWGTADLDLGSTVSTDVWDTDGDSSAINRYVPNPTFTVETGFDVWSSNEDWQFWSDGTPVIIAVEDPDGSERFSAETAIASWGEAPWESGFGTNVGPDEIFPDDTVYVTIGDTTKVLEVVEITIDDVNEESDVVAGYAPLGARVEVNVGNDEGGAHRSVDADDVTGHWQANFSQPGDEDHEQETWDIASGVNVSAQVHDEDGDSTHRGIQIEELRSPIFDVSAEGNWLNGSDWSPDSLITITFDDDDDPATVLFIEEVYTGGDGWFDVGWGEEFTVQQGMFVSVTDGTTIKTHWVTELAVESVDEAANTVSGVATPFAEVWVHVDVESAPPIVVAADVYGAWTAHFSGIHDIVAGTEGAAFEPDDDGDNTHAHWRVPGLPEFGVSATHDWIEGYDFAGEEITFTFDDPDDPGEILYEETIYVDPGEPNWIHLIQGFDVEVGQFVTATDGVTTKMTQVSPIEITEVDTVNWTVSGVADPDVVIDTFGFHPEVGGFGEHIIEVGPDRGDGLGEWTVDLNEFFDPNDRPAEIPEGMVLGGGQRDSDSDRTIVFWDPAIVEGHVLVDGEPVAGAEVFFQGTIGAQHTCTDLDGNFQFDNVSVVKALVSEGVAATGRAVNPAVACSNPDFVDVAGHPLVTEIVFGPFDLQDGYEYIGFDVVYAEAYQRVEVAEFDGVDWLPADNVPVRAYDRNDAGFVAAFGHDPDPGEYEGIWGSAIGEIFLDFTGVYLLEEEGSVEMRYPQLTDILVLVEYVDGEILGQTSDTGEFGDDGSGVLEGPTLYFPPQPNTAPEITSFEGPVDPYALGFESFVDGTFFDPDVEDTFTIEVDWGDGTTTTPEYDFVDGEGSLNDSHFYAVPGIYTITLTVRDASGAEAIAEYDSAVIFDPDGKSISGSPQVKIGDVSDKINFNIKYDKKSGDPKGHLKYTHKVDPGVENIKFDAQEIDYMWIFGDWAATAGRGVLDSTGETYEFQLLIFDGKNTNVDDTFRLKVWNPDTGEVFYDSQPGDPLFAFPTTVPTQGNINVKLK